MNKIVSLLKTFYYRHSIFFIMASVTILIFVAGCSAQGSSPPPTGPVGGGC